MHLLWKNARDYNADGSWVYNAAEDMEEYFDKMWEQEYPSISANGGGSGGAGGGKAFNKALAGFSTDETDSPAPSGTSTPMFKAAAAPKIKLSFGKKAAAPVVAAPVPVARSEDSDDSDMDDDY